MERTTDSTESPRKWTLFSKSTLHAMLIVGVTYVMTALALGWQLQGSHATDEPKTAGFFPSIAIAAIALLFTFTHCFLVGSFGLMLFRGIGESVERSNLKEQLGELVVVGFLMVWFGGWFGMPIMFLASGTGWLSLSWLCVHLAITRPGARMVAFIEHGSTSFALMLTFFVFSIGHWGGIVITLVGQVVLLTGMDRIANSGKTMEVTDRFKPESIGINMSGGWRTIVDFATRGAFVVAAIVLVFVHQGWRKTMAEYDAARVVHEEARRKLESIGGKIFGHRHPVEGYTAKLDKSSASDKGLAVLAEFSKIHELKLVGAPITDAGLKHLANIKSIGKLNLSNTQISPTGFAHLRNVTILDELNLSNTGITDSALLQFNDVSTVERVDLSGTLITGPGLAVFESCKDLEHLNLTSTPIFDDGLKFIEQAAKSSRNVQLKISGTNTSIAGLHQLQKLPNVKVAGLPVSKVASTAGDTNQSTDDDSPFRFLNLGIDEATAINDKHQVVGWYAGEKRLGKPLKRAVLLLPHDADNDGRPDTYLKDADQDGTNDQMIELGSFPGWKNGNAHVTDINNRGQIVGYIQPPMPRSSLNVPQRGFIINPLDKDDDGEPDTWFEAGKDGKSNRLMKDLGTLGGKRCVPSSINEKGQIVGWSDLAGRTARGFVLDPRDINDDGQLDWHQPVDDGPKNSLMVDIAGSYGQPATIPNGINDRGVIVGDIRTFSRKGNTRRTFVLSPMATGEDGLQTWFVDSDGDQSNDLVKPLTDAESTSINGRQMVRQGEVYNADLSQIVTWIRSTKDGPVKMILWQLDETGKVVSNRALSVPERVTKLTPLHLSHEGDIVYSGSLFNISKSETVPIKQWNKTLGYVKGINASNSIVGKIMIDRLRAHVAVSSSPSADSAKTN